MFFGFQAPGGLFIQHTTSHQWCALWPGGLVYTHSVTPFCGAQSVSRYHCFILGKKDIYVACCRFARLWCRQAQTWVGWAHTTASSYLNSGKPYLWVSEIVRLLFSQLDKTLALFSIVDVQQSNQRCPFRSCWIPGGGTIAAGGSAPKGRSSWNRYSSVENERLRLDFLMEGSIPR